MNSGKRLKVRTIVRAELDHLISVLRHFYERGDDADHLTVEFIDPETSVFEYPDLRGKRARQYNAHFTCQSWVDVADETGRMVDDLLARVPEPVRRLPKTAFEWTQISGIYRAIYLMSIEAFALVEIETCLRPLTNTASLRLLERLPDEGTVPYPCIAPHVFDDGQRGFQILVPDLSSKTDVPIRRSVRWSRTVAAVSRYIDYRQIIDHRQEKCLFLHRMGGTPLKACAFSSRWYTHLKRHFKKLKGFHLYSARSLMATALDRHLPGYNLGTDVLAHVSGDSRRPRSDAHYIVENSRLALMEECIREILDGKPPRPEQERQRNAELTEKINVMSEQLMARSNHDEEMNRLRDELRQKDELLNKMMRQRGGGDLAA